MRRKPVRILVVATAVSLVAGLIAIRFVPIPPALLQPPIQSVALLDRHGTPLREARVEERFSRELTIADVPPHVLNAVLAAEDKRFYRHRGIDWIATGRAVANGVTRGRITSGASTITQQLIKISERRPRTFFTKVIEGATALRLERLWSKEQILCAYLNRVDFGNLNIGLVAAADYYFAKPVADLSEAEAALLAGLPRNPRKLNPHVAFAAAQARQQTVLRRMQENGSLDAARCEAALAEPLRLRPPRRLFRAPHFTDLVLQQRGAQQASQRRTTLDLPLNQRVERIVHERVAQLREHNVRNAAAVVIDNASGDVIALVGSEDYFAPGSGQVNGAWAKRSAGSTLKPFTYLLALERGATPATMLADVRTSFPARDGFYRPENYNRRCYGPVRYRTALASSLNIPAVKVLLAAGGPDALHERLRAVGLTTLDRPAEIYGLGLTLGNCEARLLELTNAYASLARLGEYKPWRVLADRPASEGERRSHSERSRGIPRKHLEAKPTGSLGFARDDSVARQSYSRPEFVWLIADMLSDNSARTLAFGINSALRYDYPVACKTGTSTDFRDNWTIGFTPEFSVGVWVGNFDGAPMHEVSGVTGAGPILHEIFDHLHAEKGTSWYPRPELIVDRTVHPFTGKLLGDGDARGVREKFARDSLPAAETRDDYDSTGKVKLGSEYADWYASAENGLGGEVALGENGVDLRIASPLQGSTYLIDPDVPTSGRIPLIGVGGSHLAWRSDTLQCAVEEGSDFAIAAEGEHVITLTDDLSGRSTEVRISVRSL
ncbi:MAG: penicillin-binding protein 1C [Chthoniobacterales bacterium]|nr:penicillin-binding protein 1C [Chthoniobacterales bacterium]